MKFHCFNAGCGVHVDWVKFLRDFDLEPTDTDVDIVSKSINNYHPTSFPTDFSFIERVKGLCFSVNDVFRHYNLKKVDQYSDAYPYLRSRLQVKDLNRFGYNDNGDLCILNADKSRTLCIGFQIRNIKRKSSSKYVSYPYRRIANEMGIEVSEDGDKLDKLSLLFNIFQCDFSRDLTVLEGPMDSFLMSNSIGLAGVSRNTDMLDQLPRIRYMFDNDRDGIRTMLDKLKNGLNVFMWKRFLNDEGLEPDIKDLNELLVKCYTRKLTAHTRIPHYFTNEMLDAVNI
jgi:hypothetical protein